MSVVQIKEVVEYAQLNLLAGVEGVHRHVTTSDVSRPGMQFAGHFEQFYNERIQFIGKEEMEFYLQLQDDERQERFRNICTSSTPGIIVTRGQDIPSEMIHIANETNVPLIQSIQIGRASCRERV